MESESNNTISNILVNDPPSESLQQALCPLLQEFKSLWESVKSDYEDLKLTITKQKVELQQELVNKIDKNSQQLANISHENYIKKITR